VMILALKMALQGLKTPNKVPCPTPSDSFINPQSLRGVGPYWPEAKIQNRYDLPAIVCRSGEAGGPYLSHMSCHNTGQVVALAFTLVLVPDKKSS